MEMIAKKAAQGEAGPSRQHPVAAKPVVDMMEALRKSIVMARKPVAQETLPARKAPGRVAEIKSERPARKARYVCSGRARIFTCNLLIALY
jgi:hypothetical protein